jgi:hypothetical protein
MGADFGQSAFEAQPQRLPFAEEQSPLQHSLPEPQGAW